MIDGFVQHGRGSGGQIESGVGQFGQDGCRIEVAGGLFQRVGYDRSLGFSGREDNSHCVRVVGYGLQSDGYHRLDPGYLDTAEIAGRGGLCLVVGVGETGGGVGVAAAYIEGDVPVGADASQEETDASQVPYLLVVFRAPVVDHEDGPLAELFGS